MDGTPVVRPMMTLTLSSDHRVVDGARAAVFLNIEPMLGSFLGVELLGDRLGPSAWIGGVLIVAAAITLTSRPHGIDAAGIME